MPQQEVEWTMLINHDREKLINAIVYFAKNTNFCGKTKLFKLLYLLDFEHFRDIGKSVTGLEYYAWENGPVPKALYNEMRSPKRDLGEKISVDSIKTQHENPLMLTSAKTNFDPSHFTKRELCLLQDLSQQFQNHKADEISEVTHFENQPWHTVFYKEDGQNKKIPYEYALRENEKESMEHVIAEDREMLNNYR